MGCTRSSTRRPPRPKRARQCMPRSTAGMRKPGACSCSAGKSETRSSTHTERQGYAPDLAALQTAAESQAWSAAAHTADLRQARCGGRGRRGGASCSASAPPHRTAEAAPLAAPLALVLPLPLLRDALHREQQLGQQQQQAAPRQDALPRALSPARVPAARRGGASYSAAAGRSRTG